MDLSDTEMFELLFSAFREAAPTHYQHVDRTTLEAILEAMAIAMRMELAVTQLTTQRLPGVGFSPRHPARKRT